MYNPAIHHRRSIRLKGYNYASPGAYFVTICVQDGECVLGEVVDGEMELSDWGQAAAEAWAWLGNQYPYVTVDAWVVMPNHTHAIITIHDCTGDAPEGAPEGDSRIAPTTPGTPRSCRGDSRIAPTTSGTPRSCRGGSRTAPAAITTTKRKPLGRLVGAFKTVSTKQINVLRDIPGARFWQRNYWEHIIRNETSYRRIYEYIETNPARWEEDQLHPNAPPNRFNQGWTT